MPYNVFVAILFKLLIPNFINIECQNRTFIRYCHPVLIIRYLVIKFMNHHNSESRNQIPSSLKFQIPNHQISNPGCKLTGMFCFQTSEYFWFPNFSKCWVFLPRTNSDYFSGKMVEPGNIPPPLIDADELCLPRDQFLENEANNHF